MGRLWAKYRASSHYGVMAARPMTGKDFINNLPLMHHCGRDANIARKAVRENLRAAAALAYTRDHDSLALPPPRALPGAYLRAVVRHERYRLGGAVRH